MIVNVFGYQVNLMAVSILITAIGVLLMFYRIQKSAKLDFTDMLTKNGKSVSLTKVLQLIGGLTSTWIMIKLTLTGNITESLLCVYLAYVGAIEGYSKFIAAKYGYEEHSVREVNIHVDTE